MTTNLETPGKKTDRYKELVSIAEKALEKNLWAVVNNTSTNTSVRCITKGNTKIAVVICTGQRGKITFTWNVDEGHWITLDDVNSVAKSDSKVAAESDSKVVAKSVVTATVDNVDNPKFANVHMIDSDEIRSLLNVKYEKWIQAGGEISNPETKNFTLNFSKVLESISHGDADPKIELIETVSLPSGYHEESAKC